MQAVLKDVKERAMIANEKFKALQALQIKEALERNSQLQGENG